MSGWPNRWATSRRRRTWPRAPTPSGWSPPPTASVDAGTGEFSGEAQAAQDGDVSATYVAPPADADAVRQGASDDGQDEIEGPRTFSGEDASAADQDAADR